MQIMSNYEQQVQFIVQAWFLRAGAEGIAPRLDTTYVRLRSGAAYHVNHIAQATRFTDLDEARALAEAEQARFELVRGGCVSPGYVTVVPVNVVPHEREFEVEATLFVKARTQAEAERIVCEREDVARVH